MLIIGDIPSISHGNNLHIDTLEAVYFNPKEKQNIINNYNLKDPIYKKMAVEYYEPTDKINYNIKLYNGDTCFPFKNILLNHSISKNKEILYNDIYSNLALYKSKLKYRNTNVLEWEKNILKYNFYMNKKPLFPEKYLNMFNTLSKSLVYYNIIQKDVLPNYKKYSTNVKYTEDSLINLFSKDGISIYEYIRFSLLEQDIPKDWTMLKHRDRIEAVMEKLYSDTVLEYISKYDDIKEDDAIIYFKTSIMNISTNVEFPTWFRNFIISNYNEIISNYKSSFLYMYKTGVEHNLLELNN